MTAGVLRYRSVVEELLKFHHFSLRIFVPLSLTQVIPERDTLYNGNYFYYDDFFVFSTTSVAQQFVLWAFNVEVSGSIPSRTNYGNYLF